MPRIRTGGQGPQSTSFVQVPDVLLTDGDVSANALRTWMVLKKYARNKGVCWVSVETIARELNCTSRNAMKLLAALKELRHIERSERRGDAQRRLPTVTNLLTDVRDGIVYLRGEVVGQVKKSSPGGLSDVNESSSGGPQNQVNESSQEVDENPYRGSQEIDIETGSVLPSLSLAKASPPLAGYASTSSGGQSSPPIGCIICAGFNPNGFGEHCRDHLDGLGG